MSKFQFDTAVVVVVVVAAGVGVAAGAAGGASGGGAAGAEAEEVAIVVPHCVTFATSPNSGSGAHEPTVRTAQTLGEDLTRGLDLPQENVACFNLPLLPRLPLPPRLPLLLLLLLLQTTL